MEIIIFYKNMKFTYPVSSDSCWFDLDHKEAVHKGYVMEINADRDVYATLSHEGKSVEGYITEMDDMDINPIPDNYPLEEKTYHFIRLKKPGYYI